MTVERIQQNVLIVNSDPQVTRLLLERLAARAIHGTVVRSPAAAMEKLPVADWDLLIADLESAGGDLAGLLERFRADSPEAPAAAITAEDSVASALAALRAGCDDVLVRPLDPARVDGLLASLLPGNDVPLATAAHSGGRRLYQIAGRSRPLLEVLALARKVAPTSMPVLVTGESGTGKELIACLVHHASRRSRGPFIRVNCAALSESLLESELFGHEKGAFTGACALRQGRFERAHGGTLLLDEISETGPRLQAELLRVLETQDFERVGGSDSIRVNVRVVSTTNKDLAAEAEAGRFRRDLFFRISGMQLPVPALRDRPEDIPPLVWHFVNQFVHEARRRITSLDAKMLEAFQQYDWPGNVRQLRNVVRTALLFGEGPELSLCDVPRLPQAGDARAAEGRASTLSLRELEKQAILEALRRTNTHYTKAAALLGITDRTLREKVRRYRRDGYLAEERSWVKVTG